MAEKKPYVVTFTREQEVTVGIYAASAEEAVAGVGSDQWDRDGVVELDVSTLSFGPLEAREVREDEGWSLDEDGYNSWPDE